MNPFGLTATVVLAAHPVAHLVRGTALFLAVVSIAAVLHSWLAFRREKWVLALFLAIMALLISAVGRLIHAWGQPLRWYGSPLVIVACLCLLYYAKVRRATDQDEPPPATANERRQLIHRRRRKRRERGQ